MGLNQPEASQLGRALRLALAIRPWWISSWRKVRRWISAIVSISTAQIGAWIILDPQMLLPTNEHYTSLSLYHIIHILVNVKLIEPSCYAIHPLLWMCGSQGCHGADLGSTRGSWSAGAPLDQSQSRHPEGQARRAASCFSKGWTSPGDFGHFQEENIGKHRANKSSIFCFQDFQGLCFHPLGWKWVATRRVHKNPWSPKGVKI